MRRKIYKNIKHVLAGAMLSFAMLVEMNGVVMAALPTLPTLPGTSLDPATIAKLLKDTASQMATEAGTNASQAYHEYLADYPSGKVTNLQVIGQSIDSVTLYWSNAEIKNTQFFKVDYWLVSNANARNTVYVTKPSTAQSSTAIDSSVSVFQLTGLSQGEYTIQITPGNYDSTASDGRRYPKDAVGVVVNPYVTIQAAPAPIQPTGVSFRYLQSGYCSAVVEGVNPVDQTYGVEAELYDCYNNVNIATFSCDNYQRATAVELKSDKIVNNRFYGVRARTYLKTGTEKIYSGWSEYNYAGSKMSSITPTQKNKKISLKWKAVKGANNYSVYISKSKNSGYKKVVTTKKLSSTIAKYNGKSLKSDNIYYVKVVANYKNGGDVYKVTSAPKRVTIS